MKRRTALLASAAGMVLSAGVLAPAPFTFAAELHAPAAELCIWGESPSTHTGSGTAQAPQPRPQWFECI
jgi:hypothetical protein